MALERAIAHALHDPAVSTAHRLPGDAKVLALGAFALKGLPGVEPISQLTVPDLPSAFPPLRLQGPGRP
jgi:hypothetical protein